MSKFESLKGETNNIGQLKDLWKNINPEYVARMRLQNEFKTGLDIAKYTASIMRKDMDEYDNDTSKYTQSLGCWHGCLLYTSPSPRDLSTSRMPSSA